MYLISVKGEVGLRATLGQLENNGSTGARMTSTLHRILSEGHRSFFLLAAVWALIAGGIWELWLIGQGSGWGLTLGYGGAALPPRLWHGHEMIFGYGAAAVAGFLLTSMAGARRGFILLAVALWIAGRVTFWFAPILPQTVVMLVDLSFLPLLAGRTALILTKRRNPQQAVFLLFLTAMILGNVLSHSALPGFDTDTSAEGMRLGLLALIGLITILGGRVTPGFVRNALRRQHGDDTPVPAETPRLDRACLLLAVLLPWSSLLPLLPPYVAISLAVGHGARLLRWFPLSTRRDPLLWALILAQSMAVIGLLGWGLSGLGLGSEIAALHLLAIGVVGGMTLAIMSRAALAHSGRSLIAPRPLAWAYGAMALSAALRWAGSALWPLQYDGFMICAGLAWLAAFALFLGGLWPALTRPRPQRAAPPPPPPVPVPPIQQRQVAPALGKAARS